jgi:hypothetical protein
METRRSQADLDAMARRAATTLSDDFFEVHRGAVPCKDLEGVAVVFGNDGHNDARAQQEVKLLRDRLAKAGIDVLGFGVEAGGYTWAILCRTDDLGFLNGAVWEAYHFACGPSPGEPFDMAFYAAHGCKRARAVGVLVGA